MKLDINFDTSISAAMTKIIQDELGEVSIQIIGNERNGTMQIEVDAVATTKQSTTIMDNIGVLLSNRSIKATISTIKNEVSTDDVFNKGNNPT